MELVSSSASVANSWDLLWLVAVLAAAAAVLWWLLYCSRGTKASVVVWYRRLLDGGFRYGMLGLACAIMMGSSAGYDGPSTLSSLLQDWLQWPRNDYQYLFNALYSAYAFPNIVLPLYAGVVIERMGLRATLLLLTSFVAVGVLFYAGGVEARSPGWMIAGRVLLGIGSESLTIAQSSLVTKYFASNELSFALAVTMSMSRLSSVTNYAVMPIVARHSSVLGATWYAFAVTMFSWLCACLVAVLDRNVAVRKNSRSSDESVSLDTLASGDDDKGQRDDDSSRVRTSSSPSHAVAAATHMTWYGRWVLWLLPSHVVDFPEAFWLVTAALICFSTSTISFIPLAPKFLETKYYSGDSVTATRLVSVPDTLSVFLLPLAGLIADWLGKLRPGPDYATKPRTPDSNESSVPYKSITMDVCNGMKMSTASRLDSVHAQLTKTQQILLSGVAILLAHCMLAWTHWDPMVALLTLGVGYAGYGSVLYSLMVDMLTSPGCQQATGAGTETARVASGYGISGCLVNAVFFMTPLFLAYLMMNRPGTGSVDAVLGDVHAIDEHADRVGFDRMEIFFVCVSLLGVLLVGRIYRLLYRQWRIEYADQLARLRAFDRS